MSKFGSFTSLGSGEELAAKAGEMEGRGSICWMPGWAAQSCGCNMRLDKEELERRKLLVLCRSYQFSILAVTSYELQGSDNPSERVPSSPLAYPKADERLRRNQRHLF